MVSIIGNFEGDDLRMVCPTMIDIGIDFIRIIRLSLEVITTNEHIMDGANDMAVIKVQSISSTLGNAGDLKLSMKILERRVGF
jgi:hypothetical protein